MFADIPQDMILYVTGAFLAGWVLSRVSATITRSIRSGQRDPKDRRIRSLEAELRIAHSEREKYAENTEALEKGLEEAVAGNKKRDNVIAHQQRRLGGLSGDLKDSVKKTRQLRNELSDRATESLRSEVKLREVETELEVAQASTEFIATGVLDYSLVNDDDDEGDVDVAQAGQKAAT